jgi:hypothetical protein
MFPFLHKILCLNGLPVVFVFAQNYIFCARPAGGFIAALTLFGKN